MYLNRKLSFLLHQIIHSKLLIAFAALCFTASTSFLLDLQLHSYYFYLFIFFATFFEYNLHRIDFFNLYIPENKAPIIICLVSMLLLIISSFIADSHIFILLIPFGILSLFYTVPLKIPTIRNLKGIKQKGAEGQEERGIRIKDLPYLKIFAVSVVWSCATSLPFIFKGKVEITNVGLWLIMIEKFFFIFAITLPFDIRDKEIDSRERIKTIPHKLKLDNHTLPTLILVFLCCFQTWHYFFLGRDVGHTLALILSNLFTIYVLNSKKLQRSEYYYYGCIDATIIVQTMFIIIFL